MLKTEIIQSLQKMTNSERLELIEIASQLIRKEINCHSDELPYLLILSFPHKLI